MAARAEATSSQGMAAESPVSRRRRANHDNAVSADEGRAPDVDHPSAASSRAPRAKRSRVPPENAIRVSKPRYKELRSAVPEQAGEDERGPTRRARALRARKERAHDLETVPEDIAKRFVQVGHKYFFPDGARAFTDRGRKLTTPSENTEVVRSLVGIARARGWNEVTVSGTDRFRKEAWLAARLAGLTVRGYVATPLEQAQLVRALARTSTPLERAGRKSSTAPQARGRTADVGEDRYSRASISGELVDHGRAPYQHVPEQPMSYFVKVDTDRGTREIWGVDLERAFRDSLSKPERGDAIALRSVRREPVTVKAFERDADGKPGAQKQVATHRTRWIVEKSEFLQARAQAARVVRDQRIQPAEAVKQHPELAGTYVNLRAAQLAARRIRDPEDQRKFVATVREALANAVARGEPLAPVRLKDRTSERYPLRPRRAEREQIRARE